MPGYERGVIYATNARMRPVFAAAGPRLHAIFYPQEAYPATGPARTYHTELYPITNTMLAQLLTKPIYTGTPKDLTPTLIKALNNIYEGTLILTSWYSWLYTEGLQYGHGLLGIAPEGKTVTAAWRALYPYVNSQQNAFPALRFLVLATTNQPYMRKITVGYHLKLEDLTRAINQYLGGLESFAAA